MVKATNSAKSKGKTTRIFTSEDGLDETFWLKYLGEEYRNAVHMEVDNNNNVIPVEKKPARKISRNLNAHIEKNAERSRFVRQSADKISSNLGAHIEKNGSATRFVRQSSRDKKHLPVQSKYPTEKPEMFFDKTTSKTPNNTKNHKHFYTNNKSLNNKNKIFIHNKYKQKIIKVKPSSAVKAIHEPIVVNLPENDVSDEHQINGEQKPFVVQIPPVIYHQKADLYAGQKSNPSIKNKHRLGQTLNHKNLPHTLQHEHIATEHDFERQIHMQHKNHHYHTLAVPPTLTQTQFQPDSYMLPTTR